MKYDKIQKLKTWKNCSIFSGEEPCTKSESGGGTKNRVIEIEINNQKLFENGNTVVNFLFEHYGTAGKEFIKIISEDDSYITMYQDYFIGLNKFTTDKQAQAMAIILTADKLVSTHIFNSVTLNAFDVKEFLKSNEEVDVTERAYEYITALISKHYLYFTNESKSERWGGVIEGTNVNYVYFNKTILKEKLSKKGFDFEAVKKSWVEKGYIQKFGDRYDAPIKLNGFSTRCVKIKNTTS